MAGRPGTDGMTADSMPQLIIAAVLVVFAGVLASAESALSSVSRVRAEELAEEGRSGSKKLLRVVADPPRYLNTALLLRLAAEISAIVLVTIAVLGAFDPRWLAS